MPASTRSRQPRRSALPAFKRAAVAMPPTVSVLAPPPAGVEREKGCRVRPAHALSRSDVIGRRDAAECCLRALPLIERVDAHEEPAGGDERSRLAHDPA